MGTDDLQRRVRGAAELLEALAADRSQLAELSREDRRRLLEAAGRLSRPSRDEQRALAKALRRNDREVERRSDEALLDATGIRKARRAPVFVAPPPLLPSRASEPELRDPRKCYVCKSAFTKVHAFYDQLCGPCAELNFQKRNQTFDLTGRVALVTGARVKIGYFAALKLLRAGARVIVTTRFPRDAESRYAREPDFAAFRARLEIHGIDLRHTPSVEELCAHLLQSESRLDFIINNACQTVRRPPGFYRHLMEAERLSPAALPAAELTQLALVPEDHALGREELSLFPRGALDADLQQVDLRGRNSWRLALDEVSSVELLEVHLVNAVAPFVFNARLKPLMKRVPTADKHIVNVSAMEGQFHRAWKTDRHPHTNMAKASLNMMTRTSAADYVNDGIHMNAVDTGWITDEDPLEIAARKAEEHRFVPPLDVIDGAARILDPIFDGFLTGEHKWGLFLKDYAAAPW